MSASRAFPVVLGGYVLVQMLLILVVGYGPFRDEAFYITSGLEFWRGQPYDTDRYLQWFNGSPYAWPVLAGAAYRAAGLVGARLLALALLTTGVLLAHSASARLVGPKASLAGAIVVLAQGSTLLLGHYATYDLLAFPFVGLAFWCVVRWRLDPHWRWAALAGCAIGIAALAKYPYAVMGAPVVAWILMSRDGLRVRDATIFTVCAAVPFFAVVFAQFGTWIPPTLSNYDHPTFARWLVAAVTGAYVAIPLVCVLRGLRADAGDAVPATIERVVSTRTVLLLGLVSILMWPIVQVGSGQIASAFKHVWIGVLLGMPAIGMGAAHLWAGLGRAGRSAAVALLAVVCAIEWYALEPMTYPDFRPTVTFVMEEIPPTESVLVLGDNDRWVYAMYLYGAHRIDSPAAVVDVDAANTQLQCSAGWLVATSTDFTGRPDPSAWACPFALADEWSRGFLNHRGERDLHTSQVWRRVR